MFLQRSGVLSLPGMQEGRAEEMVDFLDEGKHDLILRVASEVDGFELVEKELDEVVSPQGRLRCQDPKLWELVKGRPVLQMHVDRHEWAARYPIRSNRGIGFGFYAPNIQLMGDALGIDSEQLFSGVRFGCPEMVVSFLPEEILLASGCLTARGPVMNLIVDPELCSPELMAQRLRCGEKPLLKSKRFLPTIDNYLNIPPYIGAVHDLVHWMRSGIYTTQQERVWLADIAEVLFPLRRTYGKGKAYLSFERSFLDADLPIYKNSRQSQAFWDRLVRKLRGLGSVIYSTESMTTLDRNSAVYKRLQKYKRFLIAFSQAIHKELADKPEFAYFIQEYDKEVLPFAYPKGTDLELV